MFRFNFLANFLLFFVLFLVVSITPVSAVSLANVGVEAVGNQETPQKVPSHGSLSNFGNELATDPGNLQTVSSKGSLSNFGVKVNSSYETSPKTCSNGFKDLNPDLMSVNKAKVEKINSVIRKKDKKDPLGMLEILKAASDLNMTITISNKPIADLKANDIIVTRGNNDKFPRLALILSIVSDTYTLYYGIKDGKEDVGAFNSVALYGVYRNVTLTPINTNKTDDEMAIVNTVNTIQQENMHKLNMWYTLTIVFAVIGAVASLTTVVLNGGKLWVKGKSCWTGKEVVLREDLYTTKTVYKGGIGYGLSSCCRGVGRGFVVFGRCCVSCVKTFFCCCVPCCRSTPTPAEEIPLTMDGFTVGSSSHEQYLSYTASQPYYRGQGMI